MANFYHWCFLKSNKTRGRNRAYKGISWIEKYIRLDVLTSYLSTESLPIFLMLSCSRLASIVK